MKRLMLFILAFTTYPSEDLRGSNLSDWMPESVTATFVQTYALEPEEESSLIFSRSDYWDPFDVSVARPLAEKHYRSLFVAPDVRREFLAPPPIRATETVLLC